MTPFLEKLAVALYDRYGEALSDACLIFPNQRSGLFFKRYLGTYAKKTLWAPRVLGMHEFIAQLAGARVPDPLSLLIELFQAYREEKPEETFENFLPWGETLLGDFNAVDRYLLSPKLVFQNVEDWRRIETDLSDMLMENPEVYIGFWKNFETAFEKNANGPVGAFKESWRFMTALYDSFQERLAARGWSYGGATQRRLCEMLAAREDLTLPASQIIFAGFADFTRAESKIVQTFIERYGAEIYWDVDKYYLDAPVHEAGRLLRKYFKQDFQRPADDWLENLLLRDKKSVKVIAAPTFIGQAQAAGQELAGLIRFLRQKAAEARRAGKSDAYFRFVPERTAIVIPDEKLLFPVLLALPPEAGVYNVTMGYPLRSSRIYTLIEQFIRLQQNKKLENDGTFSYYYQDLRELLEAPYLNDSLDEKLKTWLAEAREKNKAWLPAAALLAHAPGELRPLLRPLAHPEEAFAYLKEAVAFLARKLNPPEIVAPPIENEFLYQVYSLVNRLEDIVKEYSVALHFGVIWRIFFQLVNAARTPFSGEPLRGVQIMGMFETRNLDFENLFILSANEGALPPVSRPNSFIPTSLRKSFGLPTGEDSDSIHAYHFYRLLQRAKRIYLFYHTADDNSGGEKSRYLLQIEYEWQKRNPNLHFTARPLSVPIPSQNPTPLTIVRTAEVRAALETLQNASEFSFSPSALNTYLECRLKFYFQYVSKIRAQDDVEEEIQADTIGNIFHAALEKLYAAGKYDTNALEKLKAHVAQRVEEAFAVYLGANEPTGVNYIYREIIKTLVEDAVENDVERAPITIKSVEKFLNARLPGFPFALSGKLDRLETLPDETPLIIDFKTGFVKKDLLAKVDKNLPDLYARNKHNPKNALLRQGLFYAYLNAKNAPDRAPETTEVAFFSSRGEEDKFQQFSLSTSDIQDFEVKVWDILKEIFDSDLTFDQTKDEKSCVYCPYNKICYREPDRFEN